MLSWSLMESLATGCAVVASATPPVEEVIRSGQEGILVDFFDPQALADQVDALLEDPRRRQRLGAQARRMIWERGYDLPTCLRRQLDLVDQVMG